MKSISSNSRRTLERDEQTVEQENGGESRLGRRSFVVGAGAVVGMVATAGCIGDDDDDDDTTDDNGEDEVDVDTYLEDTPNFDSVEDFTGQDEVTIENGFKDDYNGFVFDPPAIQVDVGTTVVWEWIDDEAHSVTHEGGDFDSGDEQDHEFEYTFDEEGTWLYYCRPHQAMGQKGAVIVE